MDYLEKTHFEKQEIMLDGLVKTVLLVDDEVLLREYGERLLLRCGYRVHIASNGEEAINVYKKLGEEIDVVVLDLGMPGMGGHECLRRIISEDPQARVIVTSGYTDERSREKAINLGASAFLSKPFRINQITETIREFTGPTNP